MSPDGRSFVYDGGAGLYLRSMDSLEDQLIPGTEALLDPTFSPDGAWLAFWTVGGTAAGTRSLQKIAVVGGAPVPLADIQGNPFGIRWNQDDTILYGQGGTVMRVSADGGEPEQLLEATTRYPQLLPDETTVLFQTPDGQVAVQSLGSDAPTLLFPGLRPTYLSTGHLVYVQDEALFAVPFDAGSLAVTGGPVPLVEGVRGGNVPQYAVSESGSLAYVAAGIMAGAGGPTRTLALVGRNGVAEPLNLPPNRYVHPRLSPDGTRLVVEVGLIRFRGHVPKGGDDVQNGINEGRETGATTVQ